MQSRPLELTLLGPGSTELRQKLHTHIELCTNFAAQLKHHATSSEMVKRAGVAHTYGKTLHTDCETHLGKVDKLLEAEIAPVPGKKRKTTT